MAEVDNVSLQEDTPATNLNLVLTIDRVIGGYANNLGLKKNDVIAGVNGEPFYGTRKEFNGLFDFEDDDSSAMSPIVLTIEREGAFFNVIAEMRVICAFKEIDPTFSADLEDFQTKLRNATSKELLEYLIYYDINKNADILAKSRSLMAMVAPPLWLLNQRVPEAAAVSVLAGVLTFAVHPILGAIYYAILCLYVGREQMNLAMSFMNFKRMIFLQPIAATSELEAQETAIAIDNALYFILPSHGLTQVKPKKRKKTNKNPNVPEVA